MSGYLVIAGQLGAMLLTLETWLPSNNTSGNSSRLVQLAAKVASVAQDSG